MKKNLPQSNNEDPNRRGRRRNKESEGDSKNDEFIVDIEASKLKARNIDKFSRKVVYGFKDKFCHFVGVV